MYEWKINHSTMDDESVAFYIASSQKRFFFCFFIPTDCSLKKIKKFKKDILRCSLFDPLNLINCFESECRIRLVIYVSAENLWPDVFLNIFPLVSLICSLRWAAEIWDPGKHRWARRVQAEVGRGGGRGGGGGQGVKKRSKWSSWRKFWAES